ncbi:MAG TPA: hypothetical protein VF669_04690 [Tepidisphaeraceae bacterium]|jgi:hypothetical protein
MSRSLNSIMLTLVVALANLCCLTHAQASQAKALEPQNKPAHRCCSKEKAPQPQQHSSGKVCECCKGMPTFSNDSVKVLAPELAFLALAPVADLDLSDLAQPVSHPLLLLAPLQSHPPTLLALSCALTL